MAQKKGFALLSKERRKEIASLGGLASQKGGKAHSFNPVEAKKAGKKGALSRWGKKNK